MSVDLPRFGELPSDDDRMKIADLVGSLLCGDLGSLRPTAELVARALGWSWTYEAFGEATPETEALLMPLGQGGFAVEINEDFQPDASRMLWLTCHEVGHGLFWADGPPPRRIFRHRLAEEVFCDRFADDLVSAIEQPRMQRTA